ncbi:MAG: hypothetical protein ACJ790_16315 [Myxococcaceae bacterium]
MLRRFGILLVLLSAAVASADAPRDRFTLGGYFRIMTRPDLQGGDGRLGFWNLYGRLLNEGPYAALEMKLDVLQEQPGRNDVWASVHAKVEGGSVSTADIFNGNLGQYRVSQLYVKAGNIALDHVTWQLGTLDTYFGDLGLYDAKPAEIFFDTVGLSGRYEHERVQLLVGVGDSGFLTKGANYNTLLTGGGTLRVRIIPSHFELGVGGQYAAEPEVQGNRRAPYQTPGITYEDYFRHEVAQHFVEANPTVEQLFPNPQPARADSWKLIAYVGFGGVGPLLWNNFFINYLKRHPDGPYTETFNGRTFDIHVTEFTDERYQVNAGNEMQLRIIPNLFDLNWGLLYGYHFNKDDQIAANDDNRLFYSTVVRGQIYVTSTLHILIEGSAARELSLNGNQYRLHRDSVFRSSGGISDARGLEFGDSPERDTFQWKGGIVMSPLGRGIYTRPQLRLLYGGQYSNTQAAFGSGFVEDLSQYNVFVGPERHFHHVISLEAEGWF